MVPFCYRYVPGRVVQNDRPSVQNDWPRSKQNRWPHSNQNHRPDHQIGRPNEPESTLQAFVNATLLHRDFGIGDGWDCPLSNGYQISMIDVTDQGSVYNPETQKSGGVSERADAVFGVRTMQVAGKYIFGSRDSQLLGHLGQESTAVDGYFELDTATGKKKFFPSKEAAEQAASQLGIKFNLEPIYTVYNQNRYTWFDGFAVLLAFLPPLLAFIYLCYRVWQIRRVGAIVMTAVQD